MVRRAEEKQRSQSQLVHGMAPLVRDYYGSANRSQKWTGPLAPLAGSRLAPAPSPAPRAPHVTVVRPYYDPKQSPLLLRY
jgi:hypothetical protein